MKTSRWTALFRALEGVLVREYEKGGTAASIKAAMDRAIDQLHSETRGTRNRAQSLVARTSEKLRHTLDRDRKDQPPGPPSS